MSTYAEMIAGLLQGKSETEAQDILSKLIDQAEVTEAERLETEKADKAEMAKMSLAELEEELSQVERGTPEHKRLLAAHKAALEKASNGKQPSKAEQLSALEAREAQRAELMSELSELRRGYDTSPAKTKRIQELRQELDKLPAGNGATPGRINITRYLDNYGG